MREISHWFFLSLRHFFILSIGKSFSSTYRHLFLHKSVIYMIILPITKSRKKCNHYFLISGCAKFVHSYPVLLPAGALHAGGLQAPQDKRNIKIWGKIYILIFSLSLSRCIYIYNISMLSLSVCLSLSLLFMQRFYKLTLSLSFCLSVSLSLCLSVSLSLCPSLSKNSKIIMINEGVIFI